MNIWSLNTERRKPDGVHYQAACLVVLDDVSCVGINDTETTVLEITFKNGKMLRIHSDTNALTKERFDNLLQALREARGEIG
jgi:hypothetical protein